MDHIIESDHTNIVCLDSDINPSSNTNQTLYQGDVGKKSP